MTGDLALAFTAGALAAFNPCGFALLPAYLAMFLGDHLGRAAALARALHVGVMLTVGFVATFGVVGAAVLALSLRLGTWLSAITMLLGIVLLVIGILMAVGREPVIRLPRANLKVDASPAGMASYGVVYATVSLSCTLPVFLAAVGASFGTGTGLVAGTWALLAYSLGMGAVMTALAVAMVLLGSAAPGLMRRATPYIHRLSAAFLILAGLYIAWYAWVEFQSFRGEIITTGPTRWVADASARVSHFLSGIPPLAFIAVAFAVVASAVLVRRRTRSAPLEPQRQGDRS